MLISRSAKIAALLVAINGSLLMAQTAPAPAAKPMSDDQLNSLVAPIALYPDSLVSQILMASTYPLEVVEADRYAKANKDLKGDALAKDLEKQTWDPSVRSLVNFPQVLDMMNSKLENTTALGDVFISDQKRVLGSIQTLRAKAQKEGNLKSNEQQVVTVKQEPTTNTQVIVVEPANPQVIYVPVYNPTVVYGTWPAPTYPPYYYQPPNYVAAGVIGFGVGMACGAAWGYAWGNCNWGHGDVNVNVNQNTNYNTNINRSNYQNQINANNTRVGNTTANNFAHDASHRQGVAYGDNATAQKFGGNSASQTMNARNEYRGKANAGAADINKSGLNQSNLNNRSGTSAGTSAQNRPAASSSALGSSNTSGASARAASDRGAASRGTTPSAPARSSSPAPARSSGGSSSSGGRR